MKDMVQTSENKLPVPQRTIDILQKYFSIWEIIDDVEAAKEIANEIVHPKFAGRFETGKLGPEQVLAIARARRKAFENSRFTFDPKEVHINPDNEVVVPYIFSGIYRGEFLPPEAKGKPVSFKGTAIYRLEEGKLLGMRSIRDEEKMFKDLGITRPEGKTDEF